MLLLVALLCVDGFMLSRASSGQPARLPRSQRRLELVGATVGGAAGGEDPPGGTSAADEGRPVPPPPPPPPPPRVHISSPLPRGASSDVDILLVEFVDRRTGIPVLTSMGANRTRLELFSRYVYGRNLSTSDEVELRQRNISTRDEDSITPLLEAWRRGLVVAPTKDPLDALRPTTGIREMLSLYTRRMKTLDDADSAELDARLGVVLGKRFAHAPGGGREENLWRLRELAAWFKGLFPYYYDECDSCGNRDNDFVGYCAQTEEEARHQAGRTELYHCARCHSFTRFPRYNSPLKVLETRRGRCGEYSVLMLKMLEHLGFECRWVVDYGDHVWVEARVENDWVHVDPCEAAVDEPLLYESWDKSLSYILAFTRSDVADVTAKYTSDKGARARKRRELSDAEVESMLADSRAELLRQGASR